MVNQSEVKQNRGETMDPYHVAQCRKTGGIKDFKGKELGKEQGEA